MTAVRLQNISLDGNSLTSTDLVNLGKGLYKIKVSGLCWMSTIVLWFKNEHLQTIFLNGNALQLLSDPQLTPEAEQKVEQSRELLDTIVKENKGENDIQSTGNICVFSKWFFYLLLKIKVPIGCFRILGSPKILSVNIYIYIFKNNIFRHTLNPERYLETTFRIS